MKLKRNFSLVVLLFAMHCLFLACNQNANYIPNVPVNETVNIYDPNYQQLNILGGWAYVEGGSRGIIVFKTDVDTYQAYDRHCTYEVENSCGQVQIDETNLYAVDTCCGSSFQLLDGNPSQGPASLGLKPYNTSFDGNIIRIWN